MQIEIRKLIISEELQLHRGELLMSISNAIKVPATEGEVLSPPQPLCPFHGMYMGPGVFLQTKGNQCALKKSGPCHMKNGGEVINWDECSHNNEEDKLRISQVIKNSQAFPIELRPADKKNEWWDGVPMRTWFEFVMKRKHKPSVLH